jgi:hypothetical protein
MDNENELSIFLLQELDALQSEYERIQKRVREDPGTAGDEGEENWATLLRKWLPSEYHIVTKGRILSHKGEASPQVDIIILHPSYPPALKDKKLYLAGGVAAAFECKLTLRLTHLKKFFLNARSIKRIVPRRTGTPYLELNKPLIYGLLSHTYESSVSDKNTIKKISDKLIQLDCEIVDHPMSMFDLLCVADLGVWASEKDQYAARSIADPSDECQTVYKSYSETPLTKPKFAPIGNLLLILTRKLAWEDKRMRRIAEYYSLVFENRIGWGIGKNRYWKLNHSLYSPRLLEEIKNAHRTTNGNVYGTPGGLWDEWRASSDKLVEVSE